MSRSCIAGLALALVASALGGCTVRYSQSIVGEIRRVDFKGLPIRNKDSGTEVGLLYPVGIVFSEPMAADKLMALPCDVGIAEVDYRSKWYTYYVSVNFPEVGVTSYCISTP